MLSLPGEGIRGGRKRRLADASLVLLRYWRWIGSIVMFWKRKIKSVPPARGGFSIPEGRRVYAIGDIHGRDRSEEHTSELQSLMRISYAVFCLKKKKNNNTSHTNT